ncbi:hypothetical protein ABZ590_17685 [Streptomyces hirsutus]|uniref:hypothetical protein n=1 Tax=Streptomyces hirsutus TaxID=35620 RepID=UPI0033EE5AE1
MSANERHGRPVTFHRIAAINAAPVASFGRPGLLSERGPYGRSGGEPENPTSTA